MTSEERKLHRVEMRMIRWIMDMWCEIEGLYHSLYGTQVEVGNTDKTAILQRNMLNRVLRK